MDCWYILYFSLKSALFFKTFFQRNVFCIQPSCFYFSMLSISLFSLFPLMCLVRRPHRSSAVSLVSNQLPITFFFLFLCHQPAVPAVCPVVTAPVEPSPTPQASSAGSLDSMLGLLQSDLSRQGVQTSSKGNCSACQKPVVGQVSSFRRLGRAHIG